MNSALPTSAMALSATPPNHPQPISPTLGLGCVAPNDREAAARLPAAANEEMVKVRRSIGAPLVLVCNENDAKAGQRIATMLGDRSDCANSTPGAAICRNAA